MAEASVGRREEASAGVSAGDLLWEPSNERKQRSELLRYLRWLEERRGLRLATYDDLWRWSVDDVAGFWGSLWEFFDLRSARPYAQVLGEREMPGAKWFEGAELNYAERALARRDGHPALVARSETRPEIAISYRELVSQVTSVAAGLRGIGLGKGDRVVGYLPNIPETAIAFLAAASLGAVWSCCSPDFGIGSVTDRFQQIEPTVLFAVDGYRYNGAPHERLDAVGEIVGRLPTLQATVVVPYLHERPRITGLPEAMLWDDLFSGIEEPLTVAPVPFDHPLWVLYSSGTTGLPKAIVHGHGGILLEHLKALGLHGDLRAEDRFFWFTTTGWMMWNYLISGLLLGGTVLLYDGSPGYPDLGALWKFAEESRMTYFGTSAPYLRACMKANLEPRRERDLEALHSLGSTGAPLPPEGFGWVYEKVKRDLLLASVSGGTDLCTAFVLSCPLLPVRAGEIQCRGLGAKVEAYDDAGRSVVDEVGELVITEPLPSMPIYFWGDPEGRRYRESYFEMYPGVWRHGDWIKINRRGSCVIYGRSDSTLNRAGVRMGTSELYRAIEDLPEVTDSLVVDTGGAGEEGVLLLFVALEEGCSLGDDLVQRIKAKLRKDISPRHVPDEIHAVPAIPCTLNGKKLEVPIKRILSGTPVEEAVKRDSVSSPGTLDFFVEFARKRGAPG